MTRTSEPSPAQHTSPFMVAFHCVPSAGRAASGEWGVSPRLRSGDDRMVTGERFADADVASSDRPFVFWLERPMNVLTRFVHAVRGWHRPLVLHAALMFGLAAFSAVGVFADD